jgi:hypothetical protein
MKCRRGIQHENGISFSRNYRYIAVVDQDNKQSIQGKDVCGKKLSSC